MKVLEAIGKSFGIAGKMLSTLAFLFVFNAVWNLVMMRYMSTHSAGAAMRPSTLIIIMSVLFILANVFIQGGVLGIVKETLDPAKRPSLADFAKYGARFYLKLLALGAIIMAAVLLVILVVGVVFAVGSIGKNMILAVMLGIVALAALAVALYYLFLLFLAPYTLVVDDLGVVASLKASIQFVRSHLWKVGALSTLVVLVALGIGFCAGMLTALANIALKKGIILDLITSVLTGAVNAYVTILISAALVIYYAAVSGKQANPEAVSA